MSRFCEEIFNERSSAVQDVPVTDNVLRVMAKSVYGRHLYYPNCPISNHLIELTGHKSFTEKQVSHLIDAGYRVRVSFPNMKGEVDFTPNE